MPNVDKECTTHHFACECREKNIRGLLWIAKEACEELERIHEAGLTDWEKQDHPNYTSHVSIVDIMLPRHKSVVSCYKKYLAPFKEKRNARKRRITKTIK